MVCGGDGVEVKWGGGIVGSRLPLVWGFDEARLLLEPFDAGGVLLDEVGPVLGCSSRC